MIKKSFHARLYLPVAATLFCLFGIAFTAAAQSQGTGTIQGQVLNVSTGNFLNNARVIVQGTTIETFTNDVGVYWLTNVPAGLAVVEVRFLGMAPQTATVNVILGQVAVRNFDLTLVSQEADGRVVELEAFSVEAQSITSQSVALTEQRNAPNIKNVISPDEFVDPGEGNIGEFIKYVPGIDLTYNPMSPQAVTIRGMPASGTLIQFDGMPTASALVGTSRSFDLNTAGNANIDRIEISKVPTPDMPANAVGGSINVISKSGFSRKTPLFRWNTYMTYNAMEGEFDPSFSEQAGPDSRSSKRPVQLAYDLSYILPLNKNLGFTFAVTRAPRSNNIEYRSPTFNTNTGVLATYQDNELVSDVDIRSYKATIDWKVGRYGTFQASYYDMDRRSLTRQHFTQFNVGTNPTGDSTYVQGATPGVGSVAQNLSGNQQYRELSVGSLKYRYDGPLWKIDAFVSMSEGGSDFRDMEDGFFGSLASNRTQIVIRADGLDRLHDRGLLNLAATTRQGVSINPYDGTDFSINSVTSPAQRAENTSISYGLNVSRDMDWTIPTRFKFGYFTEVMERDNRSGTLTYTFAPPGGAAGRIANLHDVFNDPFSRSQPLSEPGGRSIYARYMSLAKLYELYRANPSWFVLNEQAAHVNRTNGSTEIEETVTALYGRVDSRFMDNKLWLVAGMRWERTEDDGKGPLNDINRTYRKDSNGNLIYPLQKITTNAVENARLQYVERGFAKKTSYDDFYPSLNASYSFSESMVLRAGYARTIGRPDLDQIIPSITGGDPADELSGRRITVVDGMLKPWTADNFDLTFEVYNLKGATASVSLYQKSMSNFFLLVDREITQADLDELELPADYSDYTIRRRINGGDAEIRGIELSWRQTLHFIPTIGRRMQIFANLTSQAIYGDNPQDFSNFSPRNINGGLSYTSRRFTANLGVTSAKWVRMSVAATNANNRAGSYNYVAPLARLDFSAQYRINKWFSIYYSVRNLTSEPRFLEIRSPGMPEYLRPRNLQFTAANHTLGIKGEF